MAGESRKHASVGNVAALLRDGGFLKTLRWRMGLGDSDGPLGIEHGGTGARSALGAKLNLGIEDTEYGLFPKKDGTSDSTTVSIAGEPVTGYRNTMFEKNETEACSTVETSSGITAVGILIYDSSESMPVIVRMSSATADGAVTVSDTRCVDLSASHMVRKSCNPHPRREEDGSVKWVFPLLVKKGAFVNGQKWDVNKAALLEVSLTSDGAVHESFLGVAGFPAEHAGASDNISDGNSAACSSGVYVGSYMANKNKSPDPYVCRFSPDLASEDLSARLKGGGAATNNAFKPRGGVKTALLYDQEPERLMFVSYCSNAMEDAVFVAFDANLNVLYEKEGGFLDGKCGLNHAKFWPAISDRGNCAFGMVGGSYYVDDRGKLTAAYQYIDVGMRLVTKKAVVESSVMDPDPAGGRAVVTTHDGARWFFGYGRQECTIDENCQVATGTFFDGAGVLSTVFKSCGAFFIESSGTKQFYGPSGTRYEKYREVKVARAPKHRGRGVWEDA